MLRKTIQCTLFSACFLATVTLLVLPALHSNTNRRMQLFDGVFLRRHWNLAANAESIVFATSPFEMCPSCGVKLYGMRRLCMGDCPNHDERRLSVLDFPMKQLTRVPGFQLRTLSRSGGYEGIISLQWFAIPFACLLGITIIRWLVARRRIRPGHCTKCSYNLTGNTTGVCPECGTPATPQVYKESSVNQDAYTGNE